MALSRPHSRSHEEEPEDKGGAVSTGGEQYAGGDDSQERSAKLGGEEKSRLGVSDIPTRDEYRERRALIVQAIPVMMKPRKSAV